MKRMLAALASGILFGAGLAVARMTDPNVILGFLDLFGRFDPTLGFVLAGAVGTTLIGFRFILRQSRPVLAPEFRLPSSSVVDTRLLLGAALFGIGWGLAGYCPGPALVGVGTGITSALIFVPAMLAGSALHHFIARRRV